MQKHTLDFKIGELTCQIINVQTENGVKSTNNTYYEHYHSSPEFHYIENGSCEFICNRKSIQVHAGQLLIIPPNTYHRITHASDNIKKLNILVDISMPPKNSSSVETELYNAFLSNNIPPLSLMKTPMVNTLLRISDHIADSKISYLKSEKMRALCELFLVDLFDHMIIDEKMNSDHEKSLILSQEYVIDSFIACAFSSNISVSDLAKKLYVSERQLYRMIKKKYGMNYREKAKENRLEIAMGFLNSSDKSIAEIAELLGYNSNSAFSVFIKNATGKTPTQIRKER